LPEVENLYGDPTANEEDLYVGPSYPVEQDEDDETLESDFGGRKSKSGGKKT